MIIHLVFLPIRKKVIFMTYEQAIQQVKNGQNVKRSGWSNQYLHLKSNSEDIEIVVTRTTRAPYCATNSDIETDDWTTA